MPVCGHHHRGEGSSYHTNLICLGRLFQFFAFLLAVCEIVLFFLRIRVGKLGSCPFIYSGFNVACNYFLITSESHHILAHFVELKNEAKLNLIKLI
jgi:hypothetical protein